MKNTRKNQQAQTLFLGSKTDNSLNSKNQTDPVTPNFVQPLMQSRLCLITATPTFTKQLISCICTI
jgi:hypothetical protein